MRFTAKSALIGLTLAAELVHGQFHQVNDHHHLAQRDGRIRRSEEAEPSRLAKRANAAAKSKSASLAKSKSLAKSRSLSLSKAKSKSLSESKSKSASLSKSKSKSKSKSESLSKSKATSDKKYSSSSKLGHSSLIKYSSSSSRAHHSSLLRYSSSSKKAASANYTSSSKAQVTSKSLSSSASRYSALSRATSVSRYTSSSQASYSSSSSSLAHCYVTSASLASAYSATPTPTTCASQYTGGATTISGTGTLPKPTAFVQRSGEQLTLGGATFRIVGPNIYWLCQDENISGVAKGTPTDKGRVREALAIAVAMGANTVRLTSCGVSVGSANSLEPTLGNFADDSSDVWDIHSYVIFAAGEYGLRVILPLVDDYEYYTGGKYTFLNWLNVSTVPYGSLFYSNADVISAYETYITTLLTHVNPYNGLAWGEDPTILAWETGNELGAYIGKEGYPPAGWTSAIAAVINKHSSSLVIDGSDGFYNYSTKATAPGLNVDAVDIMTDHGYPRNIGLLDAQIPLASTANKNFLIGEWDWTNTCGVTVADYIAAIETQPYLGDMIWNVMGHDAECCEYVSHSDGYSMYFPSGGPSYLQANKLQVVQHWYRMTGRTVPSTLPGVACPQPEF